MKIKFELTDEVTITNNTVKLTTHISGIIGDKDRPALEAAALELTKKLFDAKWAFSNFTFMPDGFTFNVTASTRIDSKLNDQLEARAEAISERGKLTMTIVDIDDSIPLHQKRDAESDLRIALIDKAAKEAAKLGGRVDEVSFSSARSQSISNSMRAMTASSYSLESTSKGISSDGVSLGHSEKILMSANLVIDTSKQVL